MGLKASTSTTLISLTLLMLLSRAAAQSGCTMALVSLSPCLNYVSGNSSTPSTSCCTRLSSVVTSQPQCLCSLLKGGSSNLGVVVNQTQALALPGACNVQTPPVSQCNAVNGPATSAPTPALSPSDSPDGDDVPQDPIAPSEADIPSGTGSSKTVPRRDVGGSNTRATFSFIGMLFLLALSSCAFSGIGF